MASYAWSVFTKRLTDPEGVYRLSATQAAWIFSAGLATFALVMVLAGRWLARVGPRPMSILGGLVMVDPPAGYAPVGRAAETAAVAVRPDRDGCRPAEILKTPQFYAIWLVFASSAVAGLMVI